MATPGVRTRLAVSPTPEFTAPVFSAAAASTAETGNVVKLDIAGLQPATTYYYAVELNGALTTEVGGRGRFATFPVGASSFKIAFASCGHYADADQSAYAAILAEQPAVFIHMGDFHYNDTSSTAIADYRRNYDSVLNQPVQAALYRNIPISYMWDDHDYCGNDSDATAPGRAVARRAYDENVPHYPFALGREAAIAQAFTIGRARVILTDLRSATSPADDPDGPAKQHMGDAQKTWFKQELIAARDAGFPLILWMSSHPWIGAPGSDADGWPGFATERREIANFIKANRIKNVVLLSGDMHALAYDDGSHSDYADGGGAPLVVLHAAALTAGGSVKGGPYTGGALAGSQQYGILEINDTGGSTIQCRFSGKQAGAGTKLAYNFSVGTTLPSATTTPATTGTVAAAAATERALINVSIRDRISPANPTVIVGFVVSGSVARNVLIRAVGPSLGTWGVDDPLADPRLQVYKGGNVLATNDRWADWGVVSNSAAFARTGAFGLDNAGTSDAAVVLNLAPGNYTAVVKSSKGLSGSVLVEVYDAP